MKYRKLRIAWSVAWGIVAALLICLWVRSYGWSDRIAFPHISSWRSLSMYSVRGRIGLHLMPNRQWWDSVKKQAVFVQGRGYTVRGEMGYLDGKGNPMDYNYPTVPEDSPVAISRVTIRQPPSSYSDKDAIIAERLGNPWGFGLSTYSAVIPHWIAVLLASLLTVSPWFLVSKRYNFSLRALLIATTLIAVGLGLIVWLR